MNTKVEKLFGSVPPKAEERRIGFFERYLSVWVALCMAAGILLGKLVPSLTHTLRGIELGKGSQVNLPIAILIWLMITPMMMKVDFTSIRNVGRKPARAPRNSARQLDREAVLDGASGHVLLPICLCQVDNRRKPISTSLAASFWPQHHAPQWSLSGAT